MSVCFEFVEEGPSEVVLDQVRSGANPLAHIRYHLEPLDFLAGVTRLDSAIFVEDDDLSWSATEYGIALLTILNGARIGQSRS